LSVLERALYEAIVATNFAMLVATIAGKFAKLVATIASNFAMLVATFVTSEVSSTVILLDQMQVVLFFNFQ